MDGLTLSLALTLHLGFEGDYNSIHPQIRYTQDDFITGLYYNSESNISYYAGRVSPIGEIDLEYGIVTNYSDAPIAPFVRAKYKNFFVAPGLERDNIGLVFGVEF